MCVDVGSDDCVSAGLVDEWLQARNELSIEIFLQHTRFERSPRLSAPEGFGNCVIRGNRAHRSPVRRPAFVDRPNDRHPAIDAEDVHGESARFVTS